MKRGAQSDDLRCEPAEVLGVQNHQFGLTMKCPSLLDCRRYRPSASFPERRRDHFTSP